MKWFRGWAAGRAPTHAALGAGTTAAPSDSGARARGQRLLAALQPITDALGRVPAAWFDVTALPGDLLADLFVVRAEEGGFTPVMRAQDPWDRLGSLSDGGAGRLGQCAAGGQPVWLAGPDARAGDGLLVPLFTDARVSHVLALLPGGGEQAVAPQEAGFRTANLPLAELPAHTEILVYWEGKRAGRRFPARGDIDPVEIPQLLRHLVILDVLGPPLDFRYRLLGDEILLRARPGLKGKRFGEIDGKGPGSGVWESARRAVETGLPRYGRAGYIGPDRFTTAVHDLTLPLSDDGARVTQLLILAQFRTWQDGSGA